jgi:hypothetical protein
MTENYTTIPLDADTRWILGQPCFACRDVAQLLRDSGHTIERSVEDEQATVIHFYLGFYMKHGAAWRDECGKEIGRLVDAVRARDAKAKETPP